MVRPVSKILAPLLFCFALMANETAYAQPQDFTLLTSGNLVGGTVDTLLLEKWRQLARENTSSAFLFTGNLYDARENRFPAALYDGFDIPLLLAPGRSEWDNGRLHGKEVIKKVEDALKEQYHGEVFMPEPACPGPEEVVLNDHLVVILLDTYWWVHKHDRRY
ncbi:MAG: hypothetical protein RBR28_08950, partial [Lentimicrobium sp.]|nr:hypothetical protein [Lentimicrobium sp.]